MSNNLVISICCVCLVVSSLNLTPQVDGNFHSFSILYSTLFLLLALALISLRADKVPNRRTDTAHCNIKAFNPFHLTYNMQKLISGLRRIPL